MQPTSLGKKDGLAMFKKIKKNKKALAMSIIIALIIALMTIVIFWLFYERIFEAIRVRSDKQICKASVYSHFATKMKNVDVFNTRIRCPVQLITIEKKDNENAKYIIARAMYDCWDQFGEGRLELFEGNNVYCAVCHHITFEDENLKVDDLATYLATAKIPKTEVTYHGKQVTYMQYLTSYKTKGLDYLDIKKRKNIPDEIIDTSKNNEYAVMFVYLKGKEKWDDFMKKMETAAPGMGIIGIGYGTVKVGGLMSSTLILKPIGIPTAIVGGIIMGYGALYGMVASYIGGEDFEWAAFVIFRPYDKALIRNELGCTNAPVAVT